MPMGMKNPLLLMGGDFEFYCLQLKNPMGIPKILMLFPVGMRFQCSFCNVDEISGYFSHRDKFSADFSIWEGVPSGL